MKLSVGLLVLSSLVGAFGTTHTVQVLSDIDTISSRAITLQNNLKALSPSNLVGAWAVHTGSRSILSALESATDTAKIATSEPFSDSDAQQILAASSSLGSVIVTTMDDLIAKKDTIQNFPVLGSAAVARNDLTDLKAAAEAYQQAMLAGARGDVKPASQAIIDNVNQAIGAAMAAYST